MLVKVFAALMIGCIAGAIDILPMLKKDHIPRASVVFMFAQWVLIGFLTPFIEWPMAYWMKGIVVAILGMIPVVILATHRNPKAIPMILICAIPLGAAIGWAGSWF